MQPAVVELDQRGTGALDLLFDDLLGEAGEVGVPNPAAGQANQRVPIAGKGQLEDDAQHAVVVVLDLDVETLAAFENQRLDRLDDRRTLEADVSGSGVLEAGLLAARAEDVAEVVEADLFADVELDQDQD